MAEPSGQKGRSREFHWCFHWFSSTAWEYPHEALVSSLMPLLPTHRNLQSHSCQARVMELALPYSLHRKNKEVGDSVVFYQVPLTPVLQNGWILAAGVSSNYLNTMRKQTLITLRFVSNYWTTALNTVWWILSKYWQLNLTTAAYGNILALSFLSNHGIPLPIPWMKHQCCVCLFLKQVIPLAL